MESRFGYDFSDVRVHTDQLAARSAEAVAAQAYTVGSDVVFGVGRYAPASRDGQRLLAHELAHVVQQSARDLSHALPADGRTDVLGHTRRVLARAPRPPAEIQVEIDATTVARNDNRRLAQEWIEGVRGRRLPAPAPATAPLPKQTRTPRGGTVGSRVGTIRRALEGIMGDGSLPASVRREAQTRLGVLDGLESSLEGLHRELAAATPPQNYSGPGKKTTEVSANAPAKTAPETPAKVPAKAPAETSANLPAKAPVTTTNPATPAETPAKATSPAPTVEGPAARGAGLRVRGLIRAGAGFGLQLLVFWWLGKKSAEAEEKRRTELLRTKVDPEVNKSLTAQSAMAEQLTAENPSLPVYGNVTADFDYTWTTSGIGKNPSIENVTDIRFVGMTISRQKINKEQLLDEVKSWGGQVSTHWATKRITYSLEVDFGETEAEHHGRELLHDAAQVARRGLSARSVAESTHWGGKELKSWEKGQDEQRRTWGERTLAEQRAYDEREQWVLAYIHYTAIYGPDDQYAAALRYLEEIRRRPRPIAGERIPLTRTHRTAAGRTAGGSLSRPSARAAGRP